MCIYKYVTAIATINYSYIMNQVITVGYQGCFEIEEANTSDSKQHL